MKLSLTDTRYVKDSITLISEIVSEASFKVLPTHVELVAMDPANVALIMFKLMGSTFVEYDVKDAETININLNDLKQVLRRVKSDDTMTLELADNKLKITLKGKQKRTFKLPLIDMEERAQKVPDLQFTSKVTMPSAELADAIEDMDIVGESVTFVVEKKEIRIQSSSELTQADVQIKGDKVHAIESTDDAKSKYSIEYLKKMIAGAKLADTVSLSLSTDYPIQIEFTEVDKLQMSFVLAPRVDND